MLVDPWNKLSSEDIDCEDADIDSFDFEFEDNPTPNPTPNDTAMIINISTIARNIYSGLIYKNCYLIICKIIKFKNIKTFFP